MAAVAFGYLLKADLDTTALDISRQMQETYDRMSNLSLQEWWKKFIAVDYSPIISQQYANPVSMHISNMGRCSFSNGPV